MRSRGSARRATRALMFVEYVCRSLTHSCAPSSGAPLAARDHLEHLGDTMAVLSLDQAARLTELGKITITRAINCRWLSARRKKDGIYEVASVEPPSPRRLHALVPWRAARLADLKADEELRRRVALAEERLGDLKAALEDMRAQRDAWQAMAQARIRPPRPSIRWPWLRATG